jgi:hypothetical protein
MPRRRLVLALLPKVFIILARFHHILELLGYKYNIFIEIFPIR